MQRRSDDDEVHSVLRSLRSGAEPTVRDVMTLLEAGPSYAVPLLPQAVVDALEAKFDIDPDVANGGMDQVAWNHGSALARSYAAAFRAVGAIENADLLDRLASALDAYRAEHGDAIAEDPVRYFIAYRKSVGGPYFPVPDPGEELVEPVLEYVIEHRSELPDPDGELPRRGQ